ncbi:HRDC domain-containing protein [Paenibacillus filicis]|uniref:HRDC domain-containing protein n=1 Tax=Paenibacillus filicis TaxID=669464 RepID=A0ABU9DDQ4_9BACL
MNLLFLNSMERVDEAGGVSTGQVSIGEEQGLWQIMWTEAQGDGGDKQQELWYEGVQWEDMLKSFREHVFAKQCEGFKPLLDMKVSELDYMDERSAYTQLLHFYSERNTDEVLYEALRQWRLKQAAQEGKAPFIVATNRLLKMISTFVPHTEDELRQLPGMGKSRTERFGKEILAMTVQTERTTAFPLDWVESRVDPAEMNGWLLEEKERKRRAELQKSESRQKLLEGIARGEMLDELQASLQVQRRELIGWIEDLDRQGYDLIPYVDLVLDLIPAAEREQAWQAFEQQGDRYLKPVLQKVIKLEGLTPKETEHAYEWLRLLRLKFRQETRVRQDEEAS